MLLTKTTNQPVKKSGKFVGSKHVDSLLANYKKERWAQNSRHIGKEDSLSVWYSIEEMEGFLAAARANGADGVKMYFGVYTADTAKEVSYEARQTIVMVASKTKALEDGSCIDKSVYYASNGAKPEILAYNSGRICPPTCGTPPPGDTSEITGFDWDNMGILIDRKDDGMSVM